jgi:hypothetical protein
MKLRTRLKILRIYSKAQDIYYRFVERPLFSKYRIVGLTRKTIRLYEGVSSYASYKVVDKTVYASFSTKNRNTDTTLNCVPFKIPERAWTREEE